MIMAYIDLSDYAPSLKHGAHNKCRWFDDRDYDYLFGKFYKFVKDTGPYAECDFCEMGYIFDEILDAIDEFLDEKTASTLGYKYGGLTYVEKQNVVDYFVESLKNELTNEGYFNN